MAKIKNASFEGSSYFSVEPDAVTQKDWLYNAIGDLAFLEEQARGAGATIDHGGQGDGSLLAYPLSNQCFFEYGTTEDGLKGKFVMLMPIFIPTNETDLTVVINTDATQLHDVLIYNVGGFGDFGPVTALGAGFGARGVAPKLNNITAQITVPQSFTGLVKTLAVQMTEKPKEMAFYNSISVYSRRPTPQNVISIDDNQEGTSAALETQTVSGATVYKLNEFEAAAVGEDLPITGLHLTRIIKSQNALAEYLTGAPAGQNAAVTLASSGATDPTRSAFYDHSTSGTNGDAIAMPIFAAPCGNVRQDLITYFTTNASIIYEHSTPPGRTTGGAGSITVRNGVYYLPDFPAGASSDLGAAFYIICTDSTASSIQVEIECFNSSGVGAGASTQARSSGGATGIIGIFMSGIDFHPDQYNRIRIKLNTDATNQNKTNNVAHFSLVGAAVYFNP